MQEDVEVKGEGSGVIFRDCDFVLGVREREGGRERRGVFWMSERVTELGRKKGR